MSDTFLINRIDVPLMSLSDDSSQHSLPHDMMHILAVCTPLYTYYISMFSRIYNIDIVHN